MYDNLDKILRQYKIKNCKILYDKDGKLIDKNKYDLLFKLNNYYDLLCLLKKKLKIVKFLYPAINGFNNEIILNKLLILVSAFSKNYNFFKLEKLKNKDDDIYLIFDDDNIITAFVYIYINSLYKKGIKNINKNSKKLKNSFASSMYYLNWTLFGYDYKMIDGYYLRRELIKYYKTFIPEIKFTNYNELYEYAKKTGILKQIKIDIKVYKYDAIELINTFIKYIHDDKANKKIAKSYIKFNKKVKNNEFKKKKDDIYRVIDTCIEENKELKLYLKKNIKKYVNIL